MATPRRYTKGFSFSGFQATNPNRPLPGSSLDGELANIETSVNEAISALGDIRRDDGLLRNGIVTRDALSPDLATGVTPATLWEAGLVYQAQDTVSYEVAFYRCVLGHTSNADFLVDLAAGRWVLYADIGPLATEVQENRDEAVAAADAAVPAAATATTQAGIATAAAAAAAANLDLFDDRYLGEKTSLPTLDNDGNALVNGALVSLTGQTPDTLNGMYIRRGGAWGPVVGVSAGLFLAYRYVATASQTTFSGIDANGLTLAYTVGAIIVTVNGVTMTPTSYTASNGTSVVFGAGLTASDIVIIHSFGSFVAADAWTKAEADLRFAAIAGSASRTFSVAAASADAHAMSRLAADGRFAAIGHVGAGGAAHANATTSVAGFQSAADKAKQDATATVVRLATLPTTSGTVAEWLSIPSGAFKIEINIDRVSLSGTDNFLVQAGSGAYDTTGYESASSIVSNGISPTLASSTAGFILLTGLAAQAASNIMVLNRVGTTNVWIASHSGFRSTAVNVVGGGVREFSGVIDRVRFTITGANTFDAGQVGLTYWSL